MRYDPETALQLTLKRAAAIRARNSRRRGIALTAGTGGCACALLGLGYALAARGGITLGETDYGAFLLPSQAGGYILAGVLAFAAGVLVTLLCLRSRNSGADPPVSARGPQPGGPAGRAEPPEETGPSEQIKTEPTERRKPL